VFTSNIQGFDPITLAPRKRIFAFSLQPGGACPADLRLRRLGRFLFRRYRARDAVALAKTVGRKQEIFQMLNAINAAYQLGAGTLFQRGGGAE